MPNVNTTLTDLNCIVLPSPYRYLAPNLSVFKSKASVIARTR
ncbi:hypothetical protein M2401_004641 [Pseudomonas sp. JUb42]|nr:hypothetical protein [Pseudomonas sp. JUb42]